MGEIKLFADYLLSEIGYSVPETKYYLLERAMQPFLGMRIIPDSLIRLV